MSEPDSFTRALAAWTQKGLTGRFAFSGAVLRPAMSESFEECVFSWLQEHHDPDARRRTSAEIAGGLTWWAGGAKVKGFELDVRASFKALEFLLGVSDRLPCLLDNASPLLEALRSPFFDALPDRGGPAPLKPNLLSLAVSALGSWCLDGQTDFSKVDAGEKFAVGELVLYVTAFPGLRRSEAVVCLVATLLVSPALLRPILKNLAPSLPTIEQLKSDKERFEGVRLVLTEAVKLAQFDVEDAFGSVNLKGYLDLVKMQPATSMIGRVPQMSVEPDRASRGVVLAKLRPRALQAGHETIVV